MMIETLEELNESSGSEPAIAKFFEDPAGATCYGFVRGEAVTHLPMDLYIPPDAMEVVLEIFEGPLDLLLYLIKKHNLDILNIPVASITAQYMEYVEVMSIFRLELAADYLEMAALLAEIKSRMLLPRPNLENGEEVDPRAELVRRLQEYERFKTAAESLDKLPRMDREIFVASAAVSKLDLVKPHPHVDLKEVLLSFKDIIKRADLQSVHMIQRETLSVREKMSWVLANLEGDKFIDFVKLFDVSEGRLGVVVTFLAILELVRETLVELAQSEPFGPIYVRAAGC
jgi:segregation and condensation protein A